MLEHGRKIACEIRPDMTLLKPINIRTTSSPRYETSKTLIERSSTSYSPPVSLT